MIFASSPLGQLGAQARAFIDRLHDLAGSGFSLPAPLQQDATWASRSLREFAKHSIAFAVRAGIAELLLAAAMPREAAEACAHRRETTPPARKPQGSAVGSGRRSRASRPTCPTARRRRALLLVPVLARA